jgi:ABC-type uncharacterized transport system substrate-binding protein
VLKLCLVHYVDNFNTEDCEKGIRKALDDNKLNNGISYSLKVFNAQGDVSTLNSIAGSIGNEDWDLIFATSTPTVQLLSKKLPGEKIVFTNVGDPVVAGVATTFEDHLPNMTGISTMIDFDGLLMLALKLKPDLKRIGTVFTPGESNSVAYRNRLEKAAKKAGLNLVAMPANTASEVMEAAKTLVAVKIDAFTQLSDNLIGSCSAAILKVSFTSSVPYFGFVSHHLEQGAVAVCARDYFQAGFEAGLMGLTVISGQDPGKIPIQFVNKTDFIVSEENAGFFNITLPDRLFQEVPNLKRFTKSDQSK